MPDEPDAPAATRGDHTPDCEGQNGQAGDQAVEQGRAVGTRQPVGGLLGLVEVGHVEERVGVTGVGDTFGIQVPCQPFPTVDPDLDGERKPGLQPHVAQPQLGVPDRPRDLVYVCSRYW